MRAIVIPIRVIDRKRRNVHVMLPAVPAKGDTIVFRWEGANPAKLTVNQTPAWLLNHNGSLAEVIIEVMGDIPEEYPTWGEGYVERSLA